MSAIPGYLTVREAADLIGVSHSQVTRYIANGQLPAIELGQQKLIRKADATKFQRPPRGNPAFNARKSSTR
jgi:excisionase family DNA binding protein